MKTHCSQCGQAYLTSKACGPTHAVIAWEQELGMLDLSDYSVISPAIMEGIEMYVKHGIKPGSFLTAVLKNDLLTAVKQADYINMKIIPVIVSYIYNEVAPSTCWGSTEAVEKWMANKKLQRDGEATSQADSEVASDCAMCGHKKHTHKVINGKNVCVYTDSKGPCRCKAYLAAKAENSEVAGLVQDDHCISEDD